MGFLNTLMYNWAMLRKPLFRSAFGLLLVIWAIFIIGYEFSLNYFFWWYDCILHFLSGGCVAMGTIWLWDYFFPTNNKHKLILVGFIGTLIVGLIWEIFEIHYGLTFLSDGIIYIRDTASDLLLDVCGGYFATLYSFKILFKNVK